MQCTAKSAIGTSMLLQHNSRYKPQDMHNIINYQNELNKNRGCRLVSALVKVLESGHYWRWHLALQVDVFLKVPSLLNASTLPMLMTPNPFSIPTSTETHVICLTFPQFDPILVRGN